MTALTGFSEVWSEEEKIPMGQTITDRFTGQQIAGVIHADHADWNPDVAWCPRCGADVGESCSVEDADDNGLGIEISLYIHVERESEEAHGPRPDDAGVVP